MSRPSISNDTYKKLRYLYKADNYSSTVAAFCSKFDINIDLVNYQKSIQPLKSMINEESNYLQNKPNNQKIITLNENGKAIVESYFDFIKTRWISYISLLISVLAFAINFFK